MPKVTLELSTRFVREIDNLRKALSMKGKSEVIRYGLALLKEVVEGVSDGFKLYLIKDDEKRQVVVPFVGLTDDDDGGD